MGRKAGIWRRSDRPGWWCWHQGKRHFLADDHKQAQDAFHRLKGEKVERIVAGRITSQELFCRWLDWVKENRASNTHGFYVPIAQGWITHVGKKSRAEEVIPHTLTQYLAGLDCSETTKSHIVTSIKTAYRWGRKQGLLLSNPLEFADVPSRDTDSSRSLTLGEQSILLRETACVPWLDDVVRTMLSCGCRSHELRVVEARHVRIMDGCWHWPKGEAPKGKAARIVWLAGDSAEITSRLYHQAKAGGPLFRDEKGRPWGTAALQKRFYRIGKKVGIPGLQARWLRHTFATRCQEKGLPSATISALLGHVDLSMLSRVYGHIHESSSVLKDAARQINS